MQINCKGSLIDLTHPKVMGILNLTPDSFYDGGTYRNESDIVNQVEKMLNEGATFIDVGGYSSRPNADDISVEEERKRVVPFVELLVKEFPEIILSIDTFRSQVAKDCLDAGAAMINDISGSNLDNKMFATAAKYNVPYIVMHMRGTPQTMKSQIVYEDFLKEIMFYFSEKIAQASALKINDLIIDPGFGFAKNTEQNFFLLKNLDLFQYLERPILVGLSRKSMLYKTLGTESKKALNATTSANTIALLNGGNILRVHDVKEAMECVKIYEALENSQG